MEHEAKLLETLRFQQIGFSGANAFGSPFYQALSDDLIADCEHDGPVTRVLAPFAGESYEAAYVLRLLGGVHRMVLSGDAPALAAYFPSTAGDGDAHAAYAEMCELMADPPPVVLDALTRPPQTNEVGRSVAIASGLLAITLDVGMPLHLREIGSSGGLNLRSDNYWYEQDGVGWGNAASPVRFVDLWVDGAPPFASGVEIVDRRGCDRNPIDATTNEGALTLLSYVWPEPATRFQLARDAIALAHEAPVTIDQADADVWLPEQLAAPVSGTAFVVYHSVVWQYLGETTQTALRTQLSAAGRAATPDTPLAWLRLEPNPEHYIPAELHLTLWDGSDDNPADRLLATTNFHGGTINWLAGQAT